MASAYFTQPDPATDQPWKKQQQAVAFSSVAEVKQEQKPLFLPNPFTIAGVQSLVRNWRFPSSRKYLWDRTASGALQYLQPKVGPVELPGSYG